VSLGAVQALLEPHFLEVLGGFAVAEGEEGFPRATRSLLLLGPREPGFWPHLQAQPEWGGADPVDRWSRRVIGQIACDLGAKALFPLVARPISRFTDGPGAQGASGTAPYGFWFMPAKA
jgi:hypothetical protein